MLVSKNKIFSTLFDNEFLDFEFLLEETYFR